MRDLLMPFGLLAEWDPWHANMTPEANNVTSADANEGT